MTDASADLLFASVAAQAEALRSKRVSSAELVEAHIARIRKVNPELNAVVQLAEERARHEAEQADRALSRGEVHKALQGIPFTIKDSLDTAGIITTGGTEGRRGFVPDRDATVVARLRRAGGILLGKTNTPELTMGDPARVDGTENDIYGRTFNPYDPSRSPGGSSGGAAAIVASGGSSLDIGSDTGGSIRVPANWCGVVGLKPNAGRVPRTGHIVPYGLGAIDSLTQVGPIARYAEDIALALSIIAGVDWQDPSVVPVTLADYREVDCRSLRLAAYSDNGLVTPSEDVVATVESTIDALARDRVRVERAVPAPLRRVSEVYQRLRDGDGGAALRRLLDKAGTTVPSEGLRRRMERVTILGTQEYSRALEAVDEFKSEMLQFMRDYDAMITPADVTPALPYEATMTGELYEAWSYSIPYNLTGWPAAVVRAGTSKEGLPVAVQIIGQPWREDVVIALCRLIERLRGGFEPPSLAWR